jgi:hypothetical protein
MEAKVVDMSCLYPQASRTPGSQGCRLWGREKKDVAETTPLDPWFSAKATTHFPGKFGNV